MAKKTLPCITAECDGQAKLGKKGEPLYGGHCYNCYYRIWYWMQRGPAALFRRQKQVRIWQNRYEQVAHETRPSNVIPLRKRA